VVSCQWKQSFAGLCLYEPLTTNHCEGGDADDAAEPAAVRRPAGPAADKAEDLIVGKWTHTAKKDNSEIVVVLEFLKGGDVTVELKLSTTTQPEKVKGKYKVLDDKTLEIEVTDMGRSKTDKGEFLLSKDRLTLVRKDGGKTEFTRVTK